METKTEVLAKHDKIVGSATVLQRHRKHIGDAGTTVWLLFDYATVYITAPLL